MARGAFICWASGRSGAGSRTEGISFSSTRFTSRRDSRSQEAQYSHRRAPKQGERTKRAGAQSHRRSKQTLHQGWTPWSDCPLAELVWGVQGRNRVRAFVHRASSPGSSRLPEKCVPVGASHKRQKACLNEKLSAMLQPGRYSEKCQARPSHIFTRFGISTET
jgi:hypothetical protein